MFDDKHMERSLKFNQSATSRHWCVMSSGGNGMKAANPRSFISGASSTSTASPASTFAVDIGAEVAWRSSVDNVVDGRAALVP